MGVFIENFKASEHPIINIIIRGIIIAIVMFLLMIFLDLSNGNKSSIGLGLAISIGGGLIISLAVFLIEIFANYLDKK
ncbi:putative membrane protein [Acinetobacter baumannii 118362]|nr:putative membrane protein [Acinetobacter baumannii 118362]